MFTIYRFTSTACIFVWCCPQKRKQYKIRFLWSLCGIVPKAHAFRDSKWDSRSTAQRQTQSPAHFPLCSERWPHPFPSCLWSLVWPRNTQMPRGFLSGNNYGHHCLFTPFLTSWRPHSMCHCVPQNDLTYTLVVSVTVSIGGWSTARITFCARWKSKRSHLSEPSEAARYRNKRRAFETNVRLINHSQPSAKKMINKHTMTIKWIQILC